MITTFGFAAASAAASCDEVAATSARLRDKDQTVGVRNIDFIRRRVEGSIRAAQCTMTRKGALRCAYAPYELAIVRQSQPAFGLIPGDGFAEPLDQRLGGHEVELAAGGLSRAGP